MPFTHRIKNNGILWTFMVLAFVISAVIGYGIWIEPNQIEIHHVWIQNPNLASVLENRVVMQLSDLHIIEIGKRERKVLDLLEEIDPDILLLTGDYVSWKGDYEAALSFLSQLHARIGVWAVMGDYDYSRSRKSCVFCHEEGTGKPTRRHSVRFLRDNSDVIKLPEGSVSIEGIDGEGGRPFIAKNAIIPTGDKLPVIMLSHNPLSFDLVSDDRNILMLAGDTHGGQVPLPSWLFNAMGYTKNALYSQGIFQQGRKTMYVSRGIGTSHLPIRLFRSPEVVVFHFKR